jgi:hypothetical protein
MEQDGTPNGAGPEVGPTPLGVSGHTLARSHCWLFPPLQG